MEDLEHSISFILNKTLHVSKQYVEKPNPP